jgi:tetratricopeptide (TPR) repeat protein
LDKYEYKASIGEINRLIDARQFSQAAEIADIIDWSKVRSVRTLCRISDLYKINRRFEDSRDVLRLARERAPENRQILFSMCELELKLNNYMLALASYNKYVDLYPNDSERFILQYKIIKAHGGGYQDQIAVLEELTSRDYRERWAYELARVYYLAEEDYLCIQECEGIYAFYGYGPYVKKALELKARLVQLSPEEEERLAYIKAGGKEPEQFYEDLSGDTTGGIQKPAGAEPPEKKAAAKTPISPSKMEFGELLNADVTLGDLIESRNTWEEEAEEEEKPEKEAEKKPEAAPEEVKSEDAKPESGLPASGKPAGGKPASGLAEDGKPAEVKPEEKPQEMPEEKPEEKKEAPPPEESGISEGAPEPKEADHGINVPALDQGIFSEEYMEKTIAQGLKELNLEEGLYFSEDSLYAQKERSREIPGSGSSKEKPPVPDGETREIPSLKREAILGERQEPPRKETADTAGKAEEKTAPEPAPKKEPVKAEEEEETLRTDRPRKTARYSEMFATEAEREAMRRMGGAPETSPASADRGSTTARLERDEILSEWRRIQQENEEGSSRPSRDRILETAGPAVRHRRRQETQTQSQGPASTRPWNAEEVREALRKSREAGDLPDNFVVASDSDTASIDLSEYTSSIPAGGDTKRLPGGRVFMPSVGSDGERETRSQEEIALEDMNLDSYTGNVIITGDEGSGTLKKAREMISRYREYDQTLVGKIAKTTGRQATPGALRDAVPKLEYGAMIIEHASGMSSDGIGTLLELLTGEEHKIIVFLIDKKTYMDALLHDYRKLRRAFTARIDIAALSMDVLLHYAEDYAISQEHSIDDSGMDALSYRLEHMQSGDHNVTLEEVRALVDEAVYYANARTPGNFLRHLTRKKYDENNMVILRDNDFLHE